MAASTDTEKCGPKPELLTPEEIEDLRRDGRVTSEYARAAFRKLRRTDENTGN